VGTRKKEGKKLMKKASEPRDQIETEKESKTTTGGGKRGS